MRAVEVISFTGATAELAFVCDKCGKKSRNKADFKSEQRDSLEAIMGLGGKGRG